MSIKSAVSAVALASAMMIVPAFAQDAAAPMSGDMMIGGLTIAEGDMPAVQAACDELSTAANTSLSDSTEDGAAAGTNTTEEDPTRAADQPPAEGLDNATTTIDLSSITLEDCTEAGLVMTNADDSDVTSVTN
ncbi:hypothetical protein [Devosia rhizoryzae]|uniref:Uncharacterized protein n=1 Tax=Devosia rhizoryzae TaxID=2774137 RepID=A0ABX7C8R7_9HYPH|nr:hypothetical protein [Devosia rhizoryzae]QQR40142.1 hypothetical protein JI748_03775 [Devosia rhizoryzae]